VGGRGKNRRDERSYLSDLLDLVNGAARRIRAVLALRFEALRSTCELTNG
jgi:hypothetical protein